MLLAWHRRPGIDVGFKRDIVVSGDKRLSLETLSLRPVVLSVAGFLEDGECDHIISTAKPFVKASEVKLMDKDKGKAAKEFRTSSTHFLNSRYYKFLRPIDERVANLTRTPLESQEDAQVLRYLEGQYYLSHHDFFDPVAYRNGEMFNNINAGHLNRLLTVFWYMTDADGGYTVRSFAWRGDLTSCCVFVCLFSFFTNLKCALRCFCCCCCVFSHAQAFPKADLAHYGEHPVIAAQPFDSTCPATLKVPPRRGKVRAPPSRKLLFSRRKSARSCASVFGSPSRLHHFVSAVAAHARVRAGDHLLFPPSERRRRRHVAALRVPRDVGRQVGGQQVGLERQAVLQVSKK